MNLKIPKNLAPGFEILIDLSIDEVKDIASIVSNIPSGTGPKKFASLLDSEYDKRDISNLSSTIYSFGSILLNFTESIDEISKMLSEAVIKSSDKKISNTETKNLEEKIEIILENSKNLIDTFKALDLFLENDITYKNGRIFSDIRLLFGEDVNEKIRNRKAIIIHKLKLESNKNGRDENYYFSLDSDDLIKMKELINRAILKEEQIKSEYSNIDFLEITD